jgi:hypothetical protein
MTTRTPMSELVATKRAGSTFQAGDLGRRASNVLSQSDERSITATPRTLRLLPLLLPSLRTTPDRYVQLWNVGPAHRQRWTVLDDVPIPTDQKVGGSSASERAIRLRDLRKR